MESLLFVGWIHRKKLPYRLTQGKKPIRRKEENDAKKKFDSKRRAERRCRLDGRARRLRSED